MNQFFSIHLLILMLAIAFQTADPRPQDPVSSSNITPETLAEERPTAQNSVRSAGLSRGINFGNMVDSPREGDWGLKVEASFFKKVAEAGFETVRLPISWSTHANQIAPYTIDEPFFQRIDWCIAQAHQHQLKIIVNVHHYEELNTNPSQEWNRALAIWQQIATRYQDEPESVVFEILNEPHGEFNTDPGLWNRFMFEALQKIRKSNPKRKVLVGPVNWNSIQFLSTFEPPADPDLIASVHYYQPFSFTHQGAPWLEPKLPLDTSWTGQTIDMASDWRNDSWNTVLNPTENGLQVEFTAGWAGLRFHSPESIQNIDQICFQIDQPLNLRISWKDTNQKEQQSLLQTEGELKTYCIELKTEGRSVSDITFQNFTETGAEPFLLHSCDLIGPGTRINLLESQSESLKNQFQKAARWSIEKGIPLHLGEFGVYRSAPADSRARWVAAVCSACDEFNIDWAYWDLAAEFRIYNATEDTWHEEVLSALIPKPEK